MSNRMRFIFRVILSILLGIIIFILSLLVSWKQHGRQFIRFGMRYAGTGSRIYELHNMLGSFEITEKELEKRLSDLKNVLDIDLPRNEKGEVIDQWERPLRYEIINKKVRIISYGKDGKPGGIGLDYDLNSDDITRKRWYYIPKEALPTFRQFLFDLPTRPIILLSAITGLLTFLLGLKVISIPEFFSYRKLRTLLIKLILITVAAINIALIASVFHVPSGH